MNTQIFKKTPLALLVMIPALGAQAANINLELTASTYAGTEDGTDSQTSGPSTEYISATAENYENSTASETFARGDIDGSFYTITDLTGYGESKASFLQSYEITNDESAEKFFDFSFAVDNGTLEIYCEEEDDDGYGSDGDEICSGEGSSAYTAGIRLNDVTIWSSHAALTLDGFESTLATSGAVLGNYGTGNNYYSWPESKLTIDLGTFAAGEVFTVEYEVSLIGRTGDGLSSYSKFAGEKWSSTTDVELPLH